MWHNTLIFLSLCMNHARYQRQVMLPDIGNVGQEKISQTRVLIVGAGGLGCPVLQYLSAAGIGTLGIVDGDTIEESNLHRQPIYQTKDIGASKAQTAAAFIKNLNPDVTTVVYPFFLTSNNALDIVEKYDIVVDCTDNFPVRYLINDACVLLKKPFVYAAIYRFEGQVCVFNRNEQSATYRCLFPNPPAAHETPNCAEAGVLGTTVGIIGLWQATEVLKMIVDKGDILDGKLLTINLLTHEQRIFTIKPNFVKSSITQLIDYEQFCGLKIKTITPEHLHQDLLAGKHWFLLDVRETYEYELVHLPNALLCPLARLDEVFGKLPKNHPIAVYCHHGIRSAAAIKRLEKHGILNAFNLDGGIDAWATQVDKSLKRY